DGDLREQLAAARAGIFDHARGELASARSRRLMIDLAEWLALGDWRLRPADPVLAGSRPATFAAESLDLHRKRLKHRGRGLAGLSDGRRHKTRIEAKKLRYATEFFASLYPAQNAQRRHAVFLDALEEMQDELGELNDQVTGPEVLARLGIDPSAMSPPQQDRAERLNRAEKAYERLMDAKRFWR
ncbi:MAG TPA: CHAD domain-containing protein, partial [Sphingomonas sp.]|nr:CHAD domain-containing protein [Sphingomonas sp.]